MQVKGLQLDLVHRLIQGGSFVAQPNVQKALAERHGRAYLGWELRGARPVCVQPDDGVRGGPAPTGLSFVITADGSTVTVAVRAALAMLFLTVVPSGPEVKSETSPAAVKLTTTVSLAVGDPVGAPVVGDGVGEAVVGDAAVGAAVVGDAVVGPDAVGDAAGASSPTSAGPIGLWR